jgi:hypothetical protein
VAGAADRELGTRLARMGDDPRDVVGAGGADDQRGPAVDVRGEDGSRVRVGGVLWSQDLALEVSRQLGSTRFAGGLEFVLDAIAGRAVR